MAGPQGYRLMAALVLPLLVLALRLDRRSGWLALRQATIRSVI